METPSSSTRRVTRSQTLAASANNTNFHLPRKIEGTSKSRQRDDRSALIDITNDSPIVGLAMGSLKTPSSAMSKKKRMSSAGQMARTPGSGEALLRGQVKSLLQKVEEEAELSKVQNNRPFFINLLNSPSGLVAPTPANTPQIFNLDATCLPCLTPSPVQDNKFLIPQMISEMLDEKKKKEGGSESENLITRSLLLDFSEKTSESSSSVCSSVLTYQEAICCGDEESSREDDDASVWSIQVNVSSTRSEEEEEVEEFGCDGDYYHYEEEEDKECDDDCYHYEEEEEEKEEEEEDGLLGELCEGISKISVSGFMGKHTRFVYNSDDEIEGTEKVVVSEACSATSGGAYTISSTI